MDIGLDNLDLCPALTYCRFHSHMFGSREIRLLRPVVSSGGAFFTVLTSHIPHLSSRLTPVGCILLLPQKMNMNSSTKCESGEVCEFEEDPGLFLRIVQTSEVNAQVQRANGVTITPKLHRNLAYRAYIVAVFGWLERGNRRHPKAGFVNLARAEWP
jgi:hypothetical protein